MKERTFDSVPSTVAHIYDHTARGVVEVQDPKDPVIMVRWGNDKKITPCIRDEVTSVDLVKKKIRKRVKKDRDDRDEE